MERIVPLFPLQVVVYPYSFYPLHIFEPRYITMFSSAIKYKSSIGLIPKLNDAITSVGTVIEVVEKINDYANGEFDVLVKGLERFVIKKWWMHSAGYAEALIDNYEDTKSAKDEAMEAALEQKFTETIKAIDIKLDDNFWKSLSRSKLKSFKIAEKSGLKLEQQIELLSEKDETARINLLLVHLEKIKEFLRQKNAAAQFVMNDGYINR